MDNKIFESLETILKSNKDSVSEISSLINAKEMATCSQKELLLKSLLPHLDGKSKLIAEYIIAALKISSIVEELRNKIS